MSVTNQPIKPGDIVKHTREGITRTVKVVATNIRDNPNQFSFVQVINGEAMKLHHLGTIDEITREVE